MQDNDILKTYIKEKRYEDCINLLKNKIIFYVVKEIQKKDSSIQYTTVSDLISTSNYYLNNSYIAQSLEQALREEDDLLEKIKALLNICELYNIK